VVVMGLAVAKSELTAVHAATVVQELGREEMAESETLPMQEGWRLWRTQIREGHLRAPLTGAPSSSAYAAA
jgi:hypothetical protein